MNLDAFKKVYNSPLELYAHQQYSIQFLEYLRNRDITYGGLFMEMGTGKTKVIIAWYDYLLKIKQVKDMLIACPLSVINTWIDEIQRHAPHLSNYIRIADGNAGNKLFQFNAGDATTPKIVITNFETLRTLFKQNGPKSLVTNVTWTPDMLILDESTRIKNIKAKTTKIALALSNHIKFRYILSGKPITRNPFDIYSQLKFLNPRILDGRSYSSFKKKIAITQWTGIYEKVVMWQNLDWLQEKIEKAAVVLDKKSAGIKLPKKVYIARRTYLTDEQENTYKMAAKENLLWIKDQDNVIISNLLTKLVKLQQITAGFLYYVNLKKKETFKFSKNVKIEMLKDILDELNGEQVIIWCLFREEMLHIKALLKDIKLTYTEIHGSVDRDDRFTALQNFKEGKTQILIAQVASACYGLNLANARYAIYFSNTFNYEHRMQSEDRIHRIGQDRTCYYIDLIVSDTVDELIKANHTAKKNLMNSSLPEATNIDDEFLERTIEHLERWNK